MRNIFLVTCSLHIIHLQAATYYVSNSGNDANSGLSEIAAFVTLQHASDIVTPGDSVVVLPGTYVGFYHTTSGTAAERIIFSAQPGVLINVPNDITDDGINLEGASYITIEGFTVNDMPRTGIRTVENEYVIIKNNSMDHCGVWGILTGFSEHITIENNLCSNSVDEHGIYFSNSADNPVIRGNICWGNNACGIHMNGDVSLGGDGIISNALVENNICFNNGLGGGSSINCDGVQNSTFRNNVIYNAHASGIALFRIDGGGPSKNNVVVNNTILQADNGRWGILITNGSTNNIVFNNIIYSYHSFRGSISIEPASMAGFHSNYNIVTERMSIDDGDSNMSLSDWQNETAQDSNSIIAEPEDMFLDVASDDYHLSTTSAGIDFGVNTYYSITAPTTDNEGNLRPAGLSCDAGAYEFGSVTTLEEINYITAISENTELLIFDLQGKLVTRILKKDVLKLSLQAGMYIYACYTSNHKLVSGKIIVHEGK
jgi:parallel beta-helix repeat protein